MLSNYLMNDVAAVRQMERFEAARIEGARTAVEAPLQTELSETPRNVQVTSEAKEQLRGHLATPSLSVRALGAEAVRLSKAAWWVPAGVAVMIILYSILGG